MVVFDNSTLTRFQLLPEVFAGPANRPPTFDPQPLLQMMPGEVLEISVDANDPRR